MIDMNRATLLGRAGRDPDVRELRNGGKTASFTLATTERRTDRDGRTTEATEWHRVVVYGGLAEAVGRMLRKGDPVLVEGRIATRAWRDREGASRTVTEIVVAGAQGTVSVLAGRRAERPGSDGKPVTEDGAASEPSTSGDAGAATAETPDGGAS